MLASILIIGPLPWAQRPFSINRILDGRGFPDGGAAIFLCKLLRRHGRILFLRSVTGVQRE